MTVIFSTDQFFFLFFIGAFVIAAWCYFLEFCMEKPGRIFWFYRAALGRAVLKRSDPDALKVILESSEALQGMNKYILKINQQVAINKAAEPFAFHVKPLGWCMNCMHPYWCMLSYVLYPWLSGQQTYFAHLWYWVTLIPMIGVSNYIFRRMNLQ